MSLLPRRFEKLKSVLDSRMGDLTILLEDVQKPHNLSAILRTCDAIGLLEVHTVCKTNKTHTFNNTAQGSQKWVKLSDHQTIEGSIKNLKDKGFKLFGTNLSIKASDYRECTYTGPTAFVLGAEKRGLSKSATELMDESIYIPMRGMVQSLYVSVAAATLLFEALRQRELDGKVPTHGEGLEQEKYNQTLFEWAYPEVAEWCKNEGRKYPKMNSYGEILEDLPRTVKFHC